MKKLVLLIVALAVALGAPGAARADDDGGQNNSAVAINTKDGSSLFKLAFKIRKVAGDAVTAENVALAYSSCTSCRTTAIAFEIVLVTGSPSTFKPQNVAVAVNENCTLCTTFATAYQWVVQVPEGARFTRDGMRELADVYRELRRLKRQDLPPEELDRLTRELAARVDVVLKNEIVARHGEHDESGHDGQAGGDETSEEPVTDAGPASTSTGGATTATPTSTGGTGTTTTGTTETGTTGTTTTGTTPTTTAPPTTTTTTQ
jgi:putative peptide zinc metalloprotease protein